MKPHRLLVFLSLNWLLAHSLPAQTLQITNQSPSGISTSQVSRIELRLDGVGVGADARTGSNYTLLHLGADRAPGGGDDRAISLTPAYADGTTDIDLLPLSTNVVNLRAWREWDYDLGASGTWNISADGESVTQTVNGLVTFFASDFDFAGSQFVGRLRVNTTSDNDFIGLVFGFQGNEALAKPDRYYCLSWRKAAQDVAEIGFKILRMTNTAFLTSANVQGLIWNGENAGKVTVLARNNAAGTGWVANTDYDFSLLYRTNGEISVSIRQTSNGSLRWQTNVVDPVPLGAGKIGFFNDSQSLVRYSGLAQSTTLPEGAYQLTVRSGNRGLRGTNGVALDGNRDGTPGDNYVSSFALDFTPPSIVNVAPAGFVTNSVSALRVFFNEAVAATFTGAGVSITGPGGQLDSGAFTISMVNSSTFDVNIPDQTTEGRYVVVIGTAVQDLAGHRLLAAFTNEFTIDRTGPRVLGTTPSGAVSNAFSFMEVQFDSPINPASFTIADVSVSGPPAPAISGVQQVSSNRWRIQFAAPLSQGLWSITIGPNLTDLAGNAMNQDGDSVNGEPAEDAFAFTLAEAMPDLALGNVSAPVSATRGQPVQISWTVTNQGLASAHAPWKETLALSTDALPGGDQPLLTLTVTNDLAPGASVTRTQTVILPATGAAGAHFIVGTVDSGSRVAESDEASNNSAVTLLPVNLLAPDLVVSSVVAPASAQFGERVSVTCVVSNAGTASAAERWSDRLYLSADAAMGGDTLLLTRAAASVLPLAPGASYFWTESVKLPQTSGQTNGSYILLVKTDSTGEQPESNEANNTSASAAIALTLPPLSDLAVSWISAPAGAYAGETLSVQWGVTNQGAAIAVAPWTETLSLSRDTVEGGDTLLATLTVTNDLAPGSWLVSTQSVTIPATGAFGDCWFVVSLDTAGQVFESNETNNTRVADRPLNVPVFLSLQLPASEVTELATNFTLTGRISRSGDTGAALAVALASRDTNELRVPALITIPAGQASTTFAVAVVADGVVDGNKVVRLTASASGAQTNTLDVIVRDGDVPRLALDMVANSVLEGFTTPAILTRNVVTSNPLVVRLTSSDDQRLLAPATVTIGANQPSVTFVVLAVNNEHIDAVKRASLTASAPGFSSASDGIDLLDNDYPALTVKIAGKLLPEGVPAATTATVTRNTNTNAALVVTLVSSDTTEGTVPASITIPAGQTSASFAIATLNDGVSDGSQGVTITASAAGFTSGSDTLIVSDANLPDLVISGLTATTNGFTEASGEIVFRLANTGLAAFSGASIQRVFLSKDATLSDDDTVLGDFDFSGVLAEGQDSERRLRFTLPITPGDYRVIVRADATALVSEALENNNLAVSASMHISAAYSATVTAGIHSAVAGTDIPLHGQAIHVSGGPAAGVTVNVAIDVRGTRRVLAASTDANGEFDLVFHPLPTEAGHYELWALHPGVSEGPAQDEFILFGMSVTPEEVSVRVNAFGSVSSGVKLVNASEVPLTGLNAAVLNPPPGVEILVIVTNTLAGLSDMPVSYRVVSAGGTRLSGTATIRFTSAEGAVADLSLNLTLVGLQARLTAQPASLAAGMVRGAQTILDFTLSNTGGRETGPLNVVLPSAPWLRVVSALPLPSLAPGETNHVTLQLVATADMALGPYHGSLVVAGSEVSLTVPFSFLAQSSAVGDLAVEAVDEFTYYAAGAPKVAGASVILRNADTAVVVARGTTDDSGRFVTNGLAEAYYSLEVMAGNHVGFRKTFLLAAGQTNETQAFLSREMVRYVWTVQPVELEDRYRITVQTEFETVVPVPVVTVEPSVIDVADMKGDVMQVDLKISNHGLIAAQQARLVLPTHRNFSFTSLATNLGDIPAETTLTVPLLIRRLNPEAKLAALKAASEGQDDCVSSAGLLWTLLCGPALKTYGESIVFQNLGKDCIGPLPPRRDPPMPIFRRGSGAIPAVWGGAVTRDGGSDGGAIITVPTHDSGFFFCDPCDPSKDTPTDYGHYNISYVLQPLISALETVAGNLPFVADTDSSLDANGSAESCCTPDGWRGLDLNGTAEGSLEVKFILLGAKLPKLEKTITVGNTTIKAEGVFYGGATFTFSGELSGEAGTGCNFNAPYASGHGEIDIKLGTEIKAKINVTISGALPEGMDESQRSFTLWSGLGLFLGFKAGATYDNADGFQWNPHPCFDGLYLQGGIHIDLPGTQFDFDWPNSDDGDDTYYLVEPNCPSGQSASRAVDLFGITDETKARIDREIRERLGQLRTPRPAVPKTAGGGGVCARVRLQLDQDLVMTRTAFNAALELDNNSPDQNLEDVTVQVDVVDINGKPAASRFVIAAPELSGLRAVDGTGVVAAGGTGRASWLLIPDSSAAPAAATPYAVSGFLKYTLAGQRVTVPLEPVLITVYPDAKLRIFYFHQRDVFSNDPFTAEVEPAEPFSLGVRVQNTGAGLAKNVQITSAQPKIIENEKGLLIDFKIVGTQVGSNSVAPSLTANFGDIPPGGVGVGRWLLTSTLHGQFIGYDAKFEHTDSLGSAHFSQVESVEIHEMIHVVRATHPADDGLPDFLANDLPDGDYLPDTLYLSDGASEHVFLATGATFDRAPTDSNLVVHVTANFPAGWAYLRMTDPATGRYHLAHVTRSDGAEIQLEDNAWITDRTFIANSRRPINEFNLHLLDHDSPGGYTLTYEIIPPPDTTPPISDVAGLPARSPAPISLHWSGSDDSASGVAGYDVFVSVNGGVFTRWLQGTRLTSALYPAVLGNRYDFYSIATDAAGNTQPAPDAPDAQTVVDLTNNAPLLIVSPTRNVNEGTTVTITNSATDTDVPAQTLTFSLLPGAPAGATIDPATGRITWPTSEQHGPGTNTFTVRVSDEGVPSLSATGTVTVIVNEVNSRPVLAAVASRTINEGEELVVTNRATDSDRPANQLTFALGSDTPAGTTLDADSGVFRWRPTESQGPSTNRLAIIVTDNGAPPLSATQQFSIIVRDSLADFTLTLGSTNVFTGESNRVPVFLNAGAGLTSLSFTLDLPPHLLTNLALRSSSAEVQSSVLQPLGSNRWHFNFTLNAAQASSGSRELTQMEFLAESNQRSAIVPLLPQDLLGFRSGNVSVPKGRGFGGQVIVVDEEPVLLAGRALSLTLYGRPGRSYALQQSTNLTATNWTEIGTHLLPGRFMTVPVTNPPAAVTFYRAEQAGGGAPTLASGAVVGSHFSFVLRGVPGHQYVIEAATNLGAAAAWVPALNLTLTNSSGLFEWTNPGERGRFFRAVQP